MKNLPAIKSRYLQDEIPVRLGGLSANLSRIRSFSRQEANRDAVEGLIDESKHFIEWTAAEMDVSSAEELIRLQVLLARWQINWESTWTDPVERNQLGFEAGKWSNRVLELSGLVKV